MEVYLEDTQVVQIRGYGNTKKKDEISGEFQNFKLAINLTNLL